jgi:DNA polymerase I-like protein with 3'-5' exonuclease and polymerase domains
MELRGIAGISRDPVMIDYFESGKDIYTEAANAYYNGILNKGLDKGLVRKLYRNPFKLGVRM